MGHWTPTGVEPKDYDDDDDDDIVGCICLTIWLPICQTDRHTGCPPIHPSAKGEHTALYAVIVFSLSLQFFIVVSSFLNSIRLFFLSRFYSFYSTLPVCMPIGCMWIHLPTVCTPCMYVCMPVCLSHSLRFSVSFVLSPLSLSYSMH